MNSTPKGERIHIGIFGKRNSGKSSLINAITNQEVAVVSEVLGTTTDPVYKSMELLPLGPVVIIDTAGIDDVGELGELRVKKTIEVLNKTDVAILVIDAHTGLTEYDKKIFSLLKEKNIPFLTAVNKIDTVEKHEEVVESVSKELKVKCIGVSADKHTNINNLKSELISLTPNDDSELSIVGDLINPGDFIVLVTPIDKAAPKGRLILPQQQVIRDIIEHDATAIITKEHELKETLQNLSKKPSLVITDSQVFLKVSADTPRDIKLTSFSVLFARYKGELEELVKGAFYIEKLKKGDKVLIVEGCTHHRQSDDIGSVKIPRWLRQIVGGDLAFDYCSGSTMLDNLEDYNLIVHCGACMLNRREMIYRIEQAKSKGVPIVNYGILIAFVQGIFERALEPFPYINELFNCNSKK